MEYQNLNLEIDRWIFGQTERGMFLRQPWRSWPSWEETFTRGHLNCLLFAGQYIVNNQVLDIQPAIVQLESTWMRSDVLIHGEHTFYCVHSQGIWQKRGWTRLHKDSRGYGGGWQPRVRQSKSKTHHAGGFTGIRSTDRTLSAVCIWRRCWS
jgi:hypothetical protein